MVDAEFDEQCKFWVWKNLLMLGGCLQMAVTTYNTSLPVAERYMNGYFLLMNYVKKIELIFLYC